MQLTGIRRSRGWRRALSLGTTALALSSVLAGCGNHDRSTGAGPSSAADSSQTFTKPTTPPRPSCPLTGAESTKRQNVKRAVLAVKIDNVDDARPQAGLNRADVVFEELVEGGLTRLMAVFQCNEASNIGPIRSARISDADILALFHGSVLGYSGANPADIPPINARGNTVLISNDAIPQYFHRDYHRAAPHNVFSSSRTLLDAGLSRRHKLHAPKPLFKYGELAQSGVETHHVGLSWPDASAAWQWHGGAWRRTQNGTPDKVADGPRVTASNVVVLSVIIAGTGLRDVLGNDSPQDLTVGHGTVWVYRDGRQVRGTWHRKSSKAPLRLKAHGKVIRLAPGRTWVELLPTGRRPVTS